MGVSDHADCPLDNPHHLGQAAINLIEEAEGYAEGANDVRDRDGLPEAYRCAAAQHRVMQANLCTQMAKVYAFLFVGSVIAQAFLTWGTKAGEE